MIAKRAVYLVLLILAFECVANAKNRVYEQGKLIDASPKYMESPVGDVLFFSPQILVGYSFQIQLGDLTYFVNVAMCCPPPSLQYKLEWAINDPIEFRFDKDKMFVKRPNGKELRARLVSVARGTASPSLSAPRRSSGPEFPPTLRQKAQHKALPVGIDSLRADDVCLML